LPALVVLAGSFAIFVSTAAYRLVSLDVRSAYLASWRIATSGTPWIEGLPIPQLDHNGQRSTWVIEAANGHTVIGRTPGVVAAGLPGYWLGGDGFSMAPGAVTAALVTACSVLFVFLCLRRLVGTGGAALAAVAFAFTTPVWTVAANGLWPHTVTVLGITGMAWSASTRRWWLAGLFGGVTVWGRLHAAVLVAVFGLLLAWWRRDRRILLRIGIPGAVSIFMICAWDRWMYGSWSPTASYDTTVFADYASTHRLDALNQLGMWIAPDRGILIWTPIILVLLPGMVMGWSSMPDWTRSLVWAGLSYTLLQATLNHFKGGEGFYGYRLGLEFLACATPALVLSVQHLPSALRRLIGPILALQFVAMVAGATADFFVPGGNGWNDNAFLLAIRTNPAALLPLLAVVVVGAALVQPRVERLLRPLPSVAAHAPTPAASRAGTGVSP
jgi:hypothetical protein